MRKVITSNLPLIVVPFLGTFNRTDQDDPLKVFRFHIEIESFSRFGFSKMSGLERQTDVVEYREGGDNTTISKSPGLTKFPDVTLERGQILAAGKGNLDILKWATQVYDASAKGPSSSGAFRRDVDIVQFDKEGTEVHRWRLKDCWPRNDKPISDLDAMASNNSLQTMVLVHEGFRLT
jgi:phage tail-like protein